MTIGYVHLFTGNHDATIKVSKPLFCQRKSIKDDCFRNSATDCLMSGGCCVDTFVYEYSSIHIAFYYYSYKTPFMFL